MSSIRQTDNNLIVDGKKCITLKKLCNIMGVAVPIRFRRIEDRINNNVTASPRRIKSGGIYFLMLSNVNVKKHLDDAMSKGVEAIFLDKKDFIKFGLNEKKYPVILVDNKVRLSRAYASLSRGYPAKKICIAGKSGKTITKRMLKDIFGDSFKTFVSGDKASSYLSVANHIMTKLNEDTEIFIQELDNTSGTIKKSARLVRPDICVLLNSTDYHKSNIDVEERKEYFEELYNLDKYANAGGVLVINNDDDEIASHVFKHNVISIGKDAKEKLNYRAVNIRQNREYLEFDILIDDSYRKAQHIRVNGTGENMVYNTLAAFAVAKYFHMGSSGIARAIERYKGRDTNGYFRNIGGRYIYLSDDAIDIDSLSDIKLLSDNILLGTDGTSFVAIGKPDSTEKEAVYEELKKKSLKRSMNNVFFLEDDAETTARLKSSIAEKMKAGDLLVFRGDFKTNISLLCDAVFGTSISKELELYSLEMINFDGVMSQVIPQLGEGEIISVEQEKVAENVKIPEEIDGIPIYKLGKHVFKDNDIITTVAFGKKLKSIGVGSFYNCQRLRELLIPSNIKIIDSGAFRNCKSLRKVVIENGVIHISNNAFRGCENLTDIYLPSSIGYIGENAFRECYDIKIHCYANSLPYIYAKDQDLNIEILTE